MAQIKHELMCCVIDAAEWYKREDFLKWLRRSHTATWDAKDPKEAPSEYSDAFIWVDSGADEGSDFGQNDVLPLDIEETIRCLLHERYGKTGWTGGFVSIRNM